MLVEANYGNLFLLKEKANHTAIRRWYCEGYSEEYVGLGKELGFELEKSISPFDLQADEL